MAMSLLPTIDVEMEDQQRQRGTAATTTATTSETATADDCQENGGETDTLRSYPRDPQQHDDQQQQQQKHPMLSASAAVMHLMKGNLGPGCLNLPHAFALLIHGGSTGTRNGLILSLVLFFLVIVQGIYSMAILCICKWDILKAKAEKKNEEEEIDLQRQQLQQPQLVDEQEQHSQPPIILQQQQQQQSQQQLRRPRYMDHPVHTFMDVAYIALGPTGSVIVEIFVFVLQAGVCCVFLSLISTNLRASFPTVLRSPTESVVATTFGLLGIVLLNNLSKLKWLSTSANILMFITILTASGTAVFVLLGYNDDNSENNDDNPENDYNDHDYDEDQDQDPNKSTSDLGSIASFVASMFFSFEGIGLVLPIEQAFMGEDSHDDNHGNGEHQQQMQHGGGNHAIGHNVEDMTVRRPSNVSSPSSDDLEPDSAASSSPRLEERQRTFLWRVLLGSMTTVASLFLLIGLTCSLAFPDIDSGSITAYLRSKYPDQTWFDVCNGLVVIAVFLTFPLQLTPAMEVLDEWFGPGCEPKCCTSCSSPTLRDNDDHNAEEYDGGRITSRLRRRRRQRIGAQQIRQEDPDQFYDEEDVIENGEVDVAVASSRDGLIVEVPPRRQPSGQTNGKDFSAIENDDEDEDDDGGFVLFQTPTSSPTPSQDPVVDPSLPPPPPPPLPPTNSCFGEREWIFRRWMMVVCCSLVVLVVNDLAILVTLFGAVGQTGLAFMPCIIHLKLERQGIVPRSKVLSFFDGCTIAFSMVVMVTGVVFSIQAIIEEKES